MVVTRSQTNKNNSSEQRTMSDNESETSFPDLLTREQMTELDSDELLNRQRNSEKDMIGQRFYDMNTPIGELTNLVLALTQQISSNPREGNELNTATTSGNSRSDSSLIHFNFIKLLMRCFLNLAAIASRVVLQVS